MPVAALAAKFTLPFTVNGTFTPPLEAIVNIPAPLSVSVPVPLTLLPRVRLLAEAALIVTPPASEIAAVICRAKLLRRRRGKGNRMSSMISNDPATM